MIATLFALLAMRSAQTSSTLNDWGEKTIATIEKYYRVPDRGLYYDAYEPGKPQRQVAFTWGVGVQLSALNAAARANGAYKTALRSYADATRAYWNDAGPVPGYDVLPGPKPVDRYYDDNEWMVMSLVDTYEVLGDTKYLDWADQTLKYVLSGKDDVLGGGVYWKENGKSSKNTCSNGPAVAACLAVYRNRRNPRYLLQAKEIYNWTKLNLQDPDDRLFWDNIGLDGKIQKTKWSYNTALMIRSACELYRITGQPQYLQDAHLMHKASVSHWLGNDGAIKDGGRFAHLLLESWTYVYREAPYANPADAPPLDTLTRPLAYVHDHLVTPDGLYSGNWNTPPNPKRFELIDQASVARGDFEIGLFLTGR